MPELTRRPAAGSGRAGRRVAWVAMALAVCGALLSAVLITMGAAHSDTSAEVGSPVETGYGSFTVTRVSEAFVPRTQGPPTMAKMTGAVGTERLQVWVRLVNQEADKPVRFSPDQLRLEVDGVAEPLEAEGSTLKADELPPASSLDGQVWFDTEGLAPKAARRLVYTAPGGDRVKVALPLAVDSGKAEQGDHRH